MNKFVIIAIAIAIAYFLLRYVVFKWFYQCKIFNDMLKDKDADGVLRYSQGRVYLLLSILSYYLTLAILTGKALKPNIDIDTNTTDTIIEALQWSIALNAGYVFGGKGLEVLKMIMTSKKSNQNTTQENKPVE